MELDLKFSRPERVTQVRILPHPFYYFLCEKVKRILYVIVVYYQLVVLKTSNGDIIQDSLF